MPGFINPQAFGQNTMAAQQMLGSKRGSKGRRKKRSTSKNSRSQRASPLRSKSSTRKKKPARLVKGSAAAKRYMASIRRKRKK